MLDAFEKITCECGKVHDLLVLAEQHSICPSCGGIVCPDCGNHLRPERCPMEG